jgi:hypothetical protein
MGSTETADHSPKETAAEKIAKAIATSDLHLLAESWLTAKDLKTTAASAPASAPEATAAAAPKTAAQPKDIKVEVASATAGRSPLQVADAQQDSFRQAVATEDQTIRARIQHNILNSQNFAIGDVLKNFDSLAQHVGQINMTGVAADLTTIKSDPSKKADQVNEQYLLQARGVILANKAMVAYDAAFKPNADSGTPNRKQLIDIARKSMADASQDKDVAQQFASRYQAYEGRVVAYKCAPAIGAAPTERAPQPAPGPAPAEKQPPAAAPAPAEKQPNPAAQTDNSQGATQDQPDKGPSDQQLAAFVQAAQAADPAKRALEQQIWGDPNTQVNSDKYLTAKKDIFSILTGMTGYSQEQRDDFQAKVLGAGSVQGKQQYIDTFASKDKNLHDVATELVKIGGDKLPALAQWYNADNANSAACFAFYTKAIEADNAGNQDQANAYWQSAQNYPLESKFASDKMHDPSVLVLDAKMKGNSIGLFNFANQTAQAGDLPSAAKLYNDSVQAADILYKQVSGKAQNQLADAQKNGRTGDSLNADDKAADAVLRGPSNSRLLAAQGLNNIAAQYKAEADKDPKNAAAFKQNATSLNQQAVNLLQEIPKVDPTYGGLTGASLTLFKQTVSDGITSAQKGEVIDTAASKKTFLQNAVVSSVSGDANLLHLATVGPNPATATAVYGYDTMQGVVSKIPVLGRFSAYMMPDPSSFSFLTSPDAAQKQITSDLRDAKSADPTAAKKAIDEHSTDLKSTSVNGISTLVAAVVGPKLFNALPGLAEKYLPEALQKVAPELPGWMKPVAYVAGGLLATVGTNEALQGAAQETLHTKMDSQSKILSESAAAYAAVALANKIPVGNVKYDPIKFSGVWEKSVKAFAIRGAVGFLPGAGVGLATHGPWSIDPQTNKPYTIEKTAASVGEYGAVTGLVAMLGPTLVAQPATNMARGLWGARNTIVAAGAVNTVFGAGDSNPTQINPATGMHYTPAETGLAGAENFGTGMVGGFAASKFLPWAAKLSGLHYLAKGGLKLANKEAGIMTPAAIEAAQKASAEALAKGPGLLNRTGSKAIEIINAPLTNRSKQIAIGSIGVGNAALGTLRVNPTEINPATGERYTATETAEAVVENFGIGIGAAYGGMRVLNISGQVLAKVGDIPIVQKAGSAIGGALDRAKSQVAAAHDGVNSARRYLGEQVEGAVNYTQKQAIVQKLTPVASMVTEKVVPIAPLVAAPVINKFLAPGSEYLRWKKADKDSNQPESTAADATQPAKQ